MIAETTRVVLESTSIRGVSKILKSQSRFLRRLWALFVLGSTSALFYSAFKVTADYLQYHVNIQTHLDIDDASPFPAVSICNNQPFSERAYQLWSSGRVQSPTEFNRELRQRGLRLMRDPQIPAVYERMRQAGEAADAATAEAFNKLAGDSMQALAATLIMDSSRMYYQNLRPDESAQLGHERNQSIVDCIFKYTSLQVQGTKGCHDRLIRVTPFSHPNHFNCLTLEFDEEIMSEVHSLTLILWLGPRENHDIRHRQGFLYDIFEQAYGLRVSIHEPGSHPRILEQGIQTEPGKMNEIKYQPVRFVRADTPKNPCLSESETRGIQFADHGNRYSYDQELCLNSRVQEAFLRTCGCLYVELPAVVQPNATYPYCGHLDDRIFDRAACARTLDQRQIRQAQETSGCLPGCAQLSYEKELSVTKWRDTQWMLHWIKEVTESWAAHLHSLTKLDTPLQDFRRNLDQLNRYFSMDNITDPKLISGGSGAGAFQFNESFTYVVVKRQSNNTLVRQEKIVLTVNALFSRIGGLCSMYIGLTLAFFVECVELLYRLLFDRAGAAADSATSAAAAAAGGAAEANDDQVVLDVTASGGLDVEEAHEKLDLLEAQKCVKAPAAAAVSESAADGGNGGGSGRGKGRGGFRCPGPANGSDDFVWIRQARASQ